MKKRISDKFLETKNKEDVYGYVFWDDDEVKYILSRVTDKICFVGAVNLISNEHILEQASNCENDESQALNDTINDFIKVINDFDSPMECFEEFIDVHDFFDHTYRHDRIGEFIQGVKDHKILNTYLDNNIFDDAISSLM